MIATTHAIEAVAPIHPGEDCVDDFPKHTDPRWSEFLRQAREQGIMDAAGNATGPCRLMRGVGPKGFLLRVEW